MEELLAVPVQDIPYLIIALLIAFTFHEYAHAYAAYRLGDSTPQEMGRLTLVPHKHLDPLGLIAIFIAGFGWAKPVEVNPHNFANPRRDDLLVSLAGPLANLIIVAVTFLVWYGAIALGIQFVVSEYYFTVLYNFFDNIVFLNIVLFIFNLLPIPPLDGFHIAKNMFLSNEHRIKAEASHGLFSIVGLLIIFTPLGDVIIDPVFNYLVPGIFNFFDTLLAGLFGLV